MKLAIMQPYFFPYIGYFQLINAVDQFVVYDNIQFTKKGWINRNRILVNGRDEYLTLPLKKDSDFLNIAERSLAGSFKTDRLKMLRRISESYKKAPEYNNVFPLLEKVFYDERENLFAFIFQSIQAVCQYLEIKTTFIISSSLPVSHQLKSQDKVIAICKALEASQYINAIGGRELYAEEVFKQHNIALQFLNSTPFAYKQFSNDFIPWLSIIDVLMFNPKEKVQQYVQFYYTII